MFLLLPWNLLVILFLDIIFECFIELSHDTQEMKSILRKEIDFGE